MRDEDARFGKVFEIEGVLDLEQVVEDPAGEILHVGGAFAEVIILHLFHGGDVAGGDGVVGEIGGHLLLADHPEDLVDDNAVLEHQQVGFKDVALGVAHALGDAALDFLDLGAGADEGVFEAFDLGRDVIDGDFTARDYVPGAMQDQNLSPADTSRHGNAVVYFFALGQSRHRRWQRAVSYTHLTLP